MYVEHGNTFPMVKQFTVIPVVMVVIVQPLVNNLKYFKLFVLNQTTHHE